MGLTRRSLAAAVLALAVFGAPLAAQKVGPPKGTVMVVGGGALGPELYARFIAAAGGPDALIIDVPTAGGDSVYPADWRGTAGLKRAGARNVVVLHTIDRKRADSDSFAAPLQQAGGVWFEGGRQWHLVDSYAGTKTEAGFHEVLARGGVVGGSSAGASILASYLLRGARSGNSIIMAPGYEAGFGFLRGVAIDQHVVARERLRDLADSLLPKHPELLGISEDEGTAWVVQQDVAEIMGRNKAFVYGGKETDPGKPFLTLHPGDRYDLGARRLLHRAIERTPTLSERAVDSLIGTLGAPQATVLVAQAGQVLVNKGYGVPERPNYTPVTTVPNFPLGEMSVVFHALAAQLVALDGKLSLDEPLSEAVTLRQYVTRAAPLASGDSLLMRLVAGKAGMSYGQLFTRRIYTPIGAHKTTLDTSGTAAGTVRSNVDELYRLALGLENERTWIRDTLSAGAGSAEVKPVDTSLGWRADRPYGVLRLAAYGTADGKRNAFLRFPEQRVSVIVLTNSDGADARRVASAIAERLLVIRIEN